MRFENFWPKLCKFCNFGPLYDGQICHILNKNTWFWFYIFNVNDYLIRKGLCHVKDNVPIYHLTESLFKIINFLVTFIFLKSCDKIWLALDCAYHSIYCTSKTEYHIFLTEEVLKNSTELHKNVKRFLEVIMGLLKDKVSASVKLTNKKHHVKKIIKKK